MRRSAPRTTPAAAGRRAIPTGLPTVALGLALTGAAMAGMVVGSRTPTGLGVMLVLATLFLAGVHLVVIGLVRVRHGTDGAGDGPTARSWLCLLADHRFVRVPAGDDAAEHWRCRRCGKRRWTRPRSAGETLNATQVDQQWIRRADGSDDRR